MLRSSRPPAIDLLVQAPPELAFLVERGEKLFNLSTGAFTPDVA